MHSILRHGDSTSRHRARFPLQGAWSASSIYAPTASISPVRHANTSPPLPTTTTTHNHPQPVTSHEQSQETMHFPGLLSAALALLAASGATAMPTTGSSPGVVTDVHDPRAVLGDDASAATQLNKRSSIMTLKVHPSDDCVDNMITYEVPDVRPTGCLPLSRAGRSVRYTIDNGYYDCKVTTWSGRDCKGSSFTLEWADVGKCFTKTYLSVTWDCTLKK
ncbi:hypothetical protein B0T18DRAFT_29438 [Schizothecium vesticola]|uniref:Uncharacterized protein n=1 Tax=Schizothecium vesticola TaxID=314040 RepID=A0AA40FAI0_9PEZI|nr:hypothetical protein B0T18DRAFT_29438 [Schizothecium vesticola]